MSEVEKAILYYTILDYHFTNQVSEVEQTILQKERFETYVERREDPRAGMADAAGGAAYLTDARVYELKVFSEILLLIVFPMPGFTRD